MGPEAAMIFAAGFGTRMGTLTKDRPKPLVEVAGKPLIDHALHLTDAMPLRQIVVNTHYHADQMEAHLDGRDRVTCLREIPEILETGGGLKNALPLLGPGPVFTLNSDTIWTGENPMIELLKAWMPEEMDALLIMVPLEHAQGHRANGDFFLSGVGQLYRKGDAERAPFVYGGIQIMKTDYLAEIDEAAFSLNQVWNRILEEGRCYGTVHTGGWVDVGTPEGIKTAEAELARNGYV